MLTVPSDNVQRLNAALPANIRIFAVIRATKTFDAKNQVL